jgi:hypothetical protein
MYFVARTEFQEPSFYYELVASGRGPRLMKLGRRVLISVEAGADWRQEMESRTATRGSTTESPHISALRVAVRIAATKPGDPPNGSIAEP